jgi:hypothetical protein
LLSKTVQFLTRIPLSVCIVSIAATRMYRGLSDYLSRTSFFHSTQLTPGAVPSNSTPFGKFIATPGPGNTSGLGSMQSDSESFVQVPGSITVASSNDRGEEKAPSVGDENV